MVGTDAVRGGRGGEKPLLILQARDARSDPAKRGLLFDLRPYVGFVIRLGSWESGLEVERIIGRDAKVIDDELKLEFLNALGALAPASPVRAWAESIPPELIDLVRQMNFAQLAVLRAVRHTSAAFDLLGGAPHLLWLVAATAAERKTPWDELSAVLAGRRRDVLAWCGGKGTQAAVNAVEAASVLRYTPGGLQHLRRIAADVTRRDISREHLEKEFPALVDFPFYRALVRDLAGQALDRHEGGRDLKHLLRDVHSLAAALNVEDLEARLRGIQQLGGLRRLHDELVEKLIATDRSFKPDAVSAKFPPAPLKGTKNIVAIRTYAELETEGRVMKHCCALYARALSIRHAAIYRVLAPERATLELDLTASHPRIVQLRGFADGPVSQETWKAVFEWHRGAVAAWRERRERKAASRIR